MVISAVMPKLVSIDLGALRNLAATILMTGYIICMAVEAS